LFPARTVTGGKNGNSLTAGQLPYWVRVVRSANSFSGYVSPDGTNWTRVGATQTINMATNVYVGLAGSSSIFSVPCQSYFSNVSISSVPVITAIQTSGTNLVFGGTSGYANGTYYVLMTTNVALPISKWQRMSTNYFDSTGNFSVTNAIFAGSGGRFYRVQLP
jgi:hypothetical protein